MRNIPLFFIVFLFVGGSMLAMFSYSLTMQHNDQGSYAWGSAVADAPRADPKQGNITAAEASSEPPLYSSQPIVSAIDVASADIYLLNSTRAHAYAASGAQHYDELVEVWRGYFNGRHLQYAEIEEADLTPTLKAGILILPSVVSLSPGERAAIIEFERKGGSVLATWSTGAKDGAGQWMGYGFLHDQFGITISGEITARDKEEFLVVSGDTPVASTLPAGNRLWLGLTKIHDQPLRVSGGSNVAGRFMDWRRTPTKNANEAIVYAEEGSSRRVYFGFPESIWQFDQENTYTLVDDVLNWLRRRPHAYLANWPYPYRSAQILEMDTEQGFPNAVNFANQLDSNGFQGTFYCLTSVARLFPKVIERLEKNHEIAYHGDVHNAFKGQSREMQSKRFDAMQQELRPFVADSSKLKGFRPPYELADEVAESLLFEKGFGHILTNSESTEAMLPYLSQESPKDFQKGLIVLPRTQLDDMNLEDEGLSASEMAMAMNGDFDLAREFGALGVLSVHTQSFDVDNPVTKAVMEFLAHIKSSGNKTWVASSGNIEAWWRNRASFRAHLKGDAAKMAVDVAIQKPGLRWSTSLVITNPVKGAKPTIKSSQAGMPTPVLVPLDDFQTAIVFSALEPGNYSYDLTF